jgi:hypothetical protein
MPQYESNVSSLFDAFVRLQSSMREQARKLRDRAADVSRDLEFAYWNLDSPGPNAVRRLGVTGYVEARLDDAGFWACWSFQVFRDEPGWIVERELEGGMAGRMETVEQLESIHLVDTDQLARQLPGLVSELFAVAEPEPPA